MGYGQNEARGIVNGRDGGALAIYRQVKAELAQNGRLNAPKPRREGIESAARRRFFEESTGIDSAAPFSMGHDDV